MKTLDEFIQERLETDPEFRAEWEASQPLFELRRALIGARIAAGLTIEELAERVGCTTATISRMEFGDGFPRVAMLFNLAAALDVTIAFTPDGAVTARQADLTEDELRELL